MSELAEAKRVYNCEEAFETLGAAGNSECAKIATYMKGHPFSANIIEVSCRRAYEKANGKIVGAPDWTKIIEWVLANGPAIMQFILQLIALFGG